MVDRWGEQVAVIRYLLRAEVDGAVTTFRVTDVLTNDNVGSIDHAGGSDASSPWRIVHHHAEHLADAATDTPGTES